MTIKDEKEYKLISEELKLKELQFNVLCQQIQLLKYQKELLEQGRTKEEISTVLGRNPFDDMKMF